MDTEQKKRIRLRIISVFALLALSVSAIGINTYNYKQKADSIKAEYSEQLENISEELTEASSDMLSLNNENNALVDKVEALENNIAGYLDEIEQLNARILVLEEDIEGHAEEKQTYLKQIDVLNSRFEKIVERYKTEKEKNSLIESENSELEEKIKLLGDELDKLCIIENSLASDVQNTDNIIQPDAIESNIGKTDEISIPASPRDKLIEILTTGAPNRWYEYPQYSGSYVSLYPKIIAYNYYDIESGESFSYNSDTVLYSASLIKAPYIYSVLREISDFEKNAERDQNGNIIYHDGEYIYDLSEIWTYDSATMLEEGSGEIMNMPDGTQMSWLDLFSYAIRRSDNVAFAQIISRFGKASFNNILSELEIHGTYYNFMDLSADDCVKLLSEIYSFFGTDDKYAALLKEWMTDSKHPEMIADSYADRAVAHKYGWDIDAFHDMAIIYDEHPYILVIMTDLDSGGDEAIDFYKAVIDATKLIHKEIHN